MKLLKEGRGTGWQHIYFTIEYETKRNKNKVGIRFRIKYEIDKYYYFGYNIVASVYVKNINKGRQIKANTPTRGAGTALFPANRRLLLV